MRYLLSDGSTSVDRLQYIKDKLELLFSTQSGSIPNTSHGINKVVNGVGDAEVLDKLTRAIQSVLTDKSYMDGIEVSLVSLTYENNSYKALLKSNKHEFTIGL